MCCCVRGLTWQELWIAWRLTTVWSSTNCSGCSKQKCEPTNTSYFQSVLVICILPFHLIAWFIKWHHLRWSVNIAVIFFMIFGFNSGQFLLGTVLLCIGKVLHMFLPFLWTLLHLFFNPEASWIERNYKACYWKMCNVLLSWNKNVLLIVCLNLWCLSVKILTGALLPPCGRTRRYKHLYYVTLGRTSFITPVNNSFYNRKVNLIWGSTKENQ